MPDKIFFDTNFVRNSNGIDHFLGEREEMERFSALAEILLPEIVVEEIKAQKFKVLRAKADQLRESPFIEWLNLDISPINDEYIKEFIQKLFDEETIEYSIVPLKNKDILDDIKHLALRNIPPFEKESDKGFKDTCIYYTILQYLEENPKDEVFLLSGDLLLAKAFLNNPKVRVIKDYNEYIKFREGYFREPYFIEKLRTELENPSINTDSVHEIELDEDGEQVVWNVAINSNGETYCIIVDFVSKEILEIREEKQATPPLFPIPDIFPPPGSYSPLKEQ